MSSVERYRSAFYSTDTWWIEADIDIGPAAIHLTLHTLTVAQTTQVIAFVRNNFKEPTP